jgi:hypothetical protein
MGWQQEIFTLLIVISGGTGQGFFIYNGTPAAGNPPVLSAVAPGTTTDPLGNTVNPILSVYGTGGQRITLNVASGVAFESFFTGASEELSPGTLEAFITNPGVSQILRFFLIGPAGSVHQDFASVFLSSAAKDGSTTAGGSLVYTDTAGTSHLYANWGITGFRMQSANPGDGNVYQGERQTVILNGSVLINAAGFTQIGAAFFLGVGQYTVEGVIFISPTAAGGTAQFEFATGGGAVIGSSGISFDDDITGTPYTPGACSFIDPALNNPFTTGTLTAGRRRITFAGTINVTTAGTCALFAAAAGGASYNVNSRVTLYNLYPSGP